MNTTGKNGREAVFHDKVFSEGGRSADRFYAIARASKGFYRRYLIDNSVNRRMLEYGCGPETHSMLTAPNGARVYGIDISHVAIQKYKAVAAEHGVTDIQGCVMDAENLAFGNGSFDLICGMGILHHLVLERSLPEIARTLKPTGSAVFLEPLAHNPLINLYRKMTPQMRTPDEHPLTIADLDLTRRYFGSIRIEYFHLTSLLALAFNGTRLFPRVLRSLEACDSFLFANVAPLRKYAWAAALVLSEPKRQQNDEATSNAFVAAGTA